MAREPELGSHFLRPAAINEIQVMTVSSRIDLVTQKREAGGSQMDPDLMRTAGLRPGTQHGKPPILRKAQAPFDVKPRYGWRAVGMNRPLEPNRRRGDFAQPHNWTLDHFLIPFGPAKNQGHILLADPTPLHGHPRRTGGLRVLGHEQDTARFAVNAVHERNLPARRKFVSKQFAQPVPQCPRSARLCWMDQKTCRLVHSQEILRFIQDPELNLILGVHAASFQATMIRLNRVTRIYSKGEGGIRALDEVSLEISFGQFAAVTGPSGCGKSTLLNLLGGLDTPDSGEIWIGDLPLHNARDAELTRYRRHDLGIVFQFYNLLPAMTVGENVELPLLLRGERKTRPRVAEALELVDLAKRMNHYPHQLSGGEMQRAAIARAVAGQPKVLLADEPTGNLDSGSAARVTETLLKIASQKITTLVIVTHSEELARLAARHISMLDGKITTQNPT
jgi:ABC-type lipoprotein export system ATPase subunit